MAIIRVQGNARGVTTNQNGNFSFDVEQAGNPTNGNLNVLCFAASGSSSPSTISSITQTNVAWTKQAGPVSGGGWNSTTELWAGVVAAAADATITVNVTGGGGAQTYIAIADACEYSGLLTVGFLDKTATNSGSSAASDTGTTANTTQNDELWVGSTEANQSASVNQSNPTNSFTLLDGASSGFMGVYLSLGFLERIVAATGTANSGTTIQNSASWAGCIATFKAAAAGVSVKKGSSLNATMMQMLNSKMLYSACKPYAQRFPKFKPRMLGGKFRL